jgi:hypothetical protein
MTLSGLTRGFQARSSYRRRVLNKLVASASLLIGVLAVSVGVLGLIYPGAW